MDFLAHEPGYLFDDQTLSGLDNFSKFHGAMRALCMSDDPWATRPAVELLCSGFSSVRPELVEITPDDDANGRRIGHFGFFRPEHRNTLWRKAAEWLQAAPEPL
jgi:predicted alpha/beta hydrolase